MIGVINYGSGNFRSVCNALDFLKVNYIELNSADQYEVVDKIILPGVGTYGDCVNRLIQKNLLISLKEQILIKQKYFLGICVGMQVLSEFGFEFEKYSGMGLIKGNVKKFEKQNNNLIPHIGWSNLKFNVQSSLFKNINEDSYFYFVHSYYFEVIDKNHVSSFAYNGIEFAASVENQNIFGVQFHPEKSQKDGLQLLKNFENI